MDNEQYDLFDVVLVWKNYVSIVLNSVLFLRFNISSSFLL